MRWPACHGSEALGASPARRRWLGAAAALALAGCDTLPRPGLKPPVLSFRDLAVREAGLQQIAFTLVIDAQNPNAIDLPISGLVFRLEIAGQELTRGAAADTKLVLPRQATSAVNLEMSARTADLLALMRRLPGAAKNAEGLDYRLKGSARWGEWPLPLDFERQGSFDPLRALRRRSPARDAAPAT
jgi:hypothetical protein